MIADRHSNRRQFEGTLKGHGTVLLRTAPAGEAPRPRTPLFRCLRHVIESINDTLLGRLDLEQRGGHTPTVTGQRRAVRHPRLAAMVAHPGSRSSGVKRVAGSTGVPMAYLSSRRIRSSAPVPWRARLLVRRDVP